MKRLTNYVLVVITSIALGCLAYLSTLANINKPGELSCPLRPALPLRAYVLCAVRELSLLPRSSSAK